MTQSTTLAEGGKNVQFTDRVVPWMKMGKITDGVKTSKEAAELGGLNFKVELKNLFFSSMNSDLNDVVMTEIVNRKAVVHENGTPLGIVSAGYPILQYSDAFDFMDTVANGADSRYVAAGSLKGGKQGFMVVRAPEEFQINVLDGGDPHEMFMVLRTSHDLTRAIEVMAMPLRGKCMNQLTLSSFSNQVPNRWAVRHTSTMQAKLAEAKDSIGKLGAYAQRFNELAVRLAAIKVNDEKAKYVLGHVISNRPKKDEVITTIIQKMNNAPTVGFKGTGWGLVNAVSEYYEWGRQGGSPESRFLAALQGQTMKAINKTAVHLLRSVQK